MEKARWIAVRSSSGEARIGNSLREFCACALQATAMAAKKMTTMARVSRLQD